LGEAPLYVSIATSAMLNHHVSESRVKQGSLAHNTPPHTQDHHRPLGIGLL